MGKVEEAWDVANAALILNSNVAMYVLKQEVIVLHEDITSSDAQCRVRNHCTAYRRKFVPWVDSATTVPIARHKSDFLALFLDITSKFTKIKDVFFLVSERLLQDSPSMINRDEAKCFIRDPISVGSTTLTLCKLFLLH